MGLIHVQNGKPIYYPNPGFNVKACILWTAVYGVIWAVVGVSVALGSMFVHLVAFPTAYMLSRKFRCSFTYFHYVITPFLNHEKPKDFNVQGARNLYIRHRSHVDNCDVELGVWHILPKAVYKKNKELIDNATKEEINKLFDEELKNTDHPVFLYCHGIIESRAFYHRVELYNVLQELDAHVITYDYRGFADSTLVVPSKAGMVEDTLVVYSWLCTLVGSEKPVFIWAHSIGTGIALKCFSQLQLLSGSLGLDLPAPPRAFILEAGFNNIYEVLDHFPFAKIFNWMPHFYLFMVQTIQGSPDIRILPQEYVKTLTTQPVLMLHARDDDVVPYMSGTKLYGHIVKSRKNEEERPIFKDFATGGHMHLCREKNLPGIIEDFIKKYK